MPWDIRPALVVLWGVCWMFYSHPGTPQPDQCFKIQYSEPLDINLEIPYEPNQFQDSLDPPWDLPQGTSEDFRQLTHDLDFFARLSLPGAWFGEGQDDFRQVETSDISALQASESSEQTRIRVLTCAGDASQNDLNGYETFATIPHVVPTNLTRSSMSLSGQDLTQSDLITTLPTTEAVDNQTLQTVPISQTPIHIERYTDPPRDSEGSIICDRDGCSSIRFPTNSAWRTHIDRHNRPYKCEFANCPYTTKGFGSMGELQRHTNSVHKRLNLSCSVPGCSYSCARKDNLQGHINRQHKHRIPENPATLQGGRNSPAGDKDVPNSNFGRRASPAGRVDVTVRGTRKRRRSQEGSWSLKNVGSANEGLHELQEENRKLRKKVGALERELELSRKREETLFDVIRKYTKQSN